VRVLTAIVQTKFTGKVLFVFVEVEYGYVYVPHVDDAVTIHVRIGIPVRRGRFRVEEQYHMLYVSHVHYPVRDASDRT